MHACYLLVYYVIALLAFVEQPVYIIDEADKNIEICVVLEGMLEAEIIVEFLTEDESATGILFFFSVLHHSNFL